MSNIKKYDYLNFLLQTTYRDLIRYDITDSQRKIIRGFVGKLTSSDDILRDLYLLTHVKNFKNIGRYLIFVLKKIEENVINFDNLLFNAEKDKTYLRNELLENFSNPSLKQKPEYDPFEEFTEEEVFVNKPEETDELHKDEEEIPEETEEHDITEEDEHEEKFTGGGKYLELIRSEEQSDIVFVLPFSGQEEGTAFELPAESDTEDIKFTEAEEEILKEKEDSIIKEEEKEDSELVLENEVTETSEEPDETIAGKNEFTDENQEEEEIIIESADDFYTDKESSFRIVSTMSGIPDKETEPAEESGEMPASAEIELSTDVENEIPALAEKKADNEFEKIEIDKPIEEGTEKEEEEIFDEEKSKDRIELSEEIQEELKSAEENPEEAEAGDEFEIEEEITEEEDLPVTNAEFLDFEQEIEKKNNQLKNDFDIMIYLVKVRTGDEEERNSIIKSIMEISEHLEIKSRKMTLEIISNMYQTINLSFEKISDGKYDISESTLLLFKKGLDFIMGMIRGDNYYDYKDVFKSTENIRKKLLAEKQKREEYQKKQTEKQELEKRLSSKYPDDTQRAKLAELRKLISDTENKFIMIEKISGEYKTYEALRSLSLCLINFKEIVKLSNELGLNTMSKLAESGYIFLKFLQGYRINPETEEIRETNRYIIKCLKAIYMDKSPEDIEIFISYLNDPVKILGKSEFKN